MNITDENNVKPKSVIINGGIHYKFKNYCRGKNLKMGGKIEDLINIYLDQPKNMERIIETYKDDIVALSNHG